MTSLEKKVGSDEPDVFSRLCGFIEAHEKELQEHGAGGLPVPRLTTPHQLQPWEAADEE